MPNHSDVQHRTHQVPAIFIVALLIGLILSGCNSKPKVYRVGILSGLVVFDDIANGFRAKMTTLGYIEGRNIVYDLQKANVDPARELIIAKKFVADKVDLILAFPTSAAEMAKAATQGTNIPVVFAMAGIEGNDLIKSVRQPGGNITGVRFPAMELSVKRLELLHELAPNAKRIYITYDSNYPGISILIDAVRAAAHSMNVTLVEVPVIRLDQIKADLQAREMSDDIGIDAVLIIPTLLTAGPNGFGLINEFSAKHKLAVSGTTNFHADLGAVFSEVPANVNVGELAAPMADKIFKGIPAGTIPVVTPEACLRLNYKMIKKLKLKVSEGLLSQANYIIR